MSRDVNIDELETFEDDRGGFDGGPKKKVPGLRAFIGVLLLIALCLIGWIVYKNVIVPKLQQQEQAEKASPNRANNLPRASFATTPGNADEEPVEQPAEQAQSASTYQQQAHQTQPGQQGKVELRRSAWMLLWRPPLTWPSRRRSRTTTAPDSVTNRSWAPCLPPN
ncbi:TPA: hypothetical protein ACNVXO_006544 [Pseudomonas aeruginosa]